MTVSAICSLLGGLGLFLYGMDSMRRHLEEAAGKRMLDILKTVTATTMRGFLAGTGITAAVQSSTVVIVLLVGLVEAGTLTLGQTVGVILGANIGTTVTSQLIAMNMEAVAPLLAFGGVVLLLFSKKEKWCSTGGVSAGLGLMFMGLSMMEHAMEPLGESESFLNILTACRGPVAGILVGTIFTALLQSSTASVSILQTLAKCGLVDVGQSIYIVFGQNMGTCFTALLASAGLSIAAKRTALLHLMINVLGTILFLILCRLLPVTELMEKLAPGEPARQIADIHTIFNVGTSLALLPFGKALVRLTERLMPEGKS